MRVHLLEAGQGEDSDLTDLPKDLDVGALLTVVMDGFEVTPLRAECHSEEGPPYSHSVCFEGSAELYFWLWGPVSGDRARAILDSHIEFWRVSR